MSDTIDYIIIGVGIGFLIGIFFIMILIHSTGLFNDLDILLSLADCELLIENGMQFQHHLVKDYVMDVCLR